MAAVSPHESRNLVVCCDGTGNVWKPGPRKTNVVKLVESLLHDPRRQLYYYDPGVGTPDGYVSEAGQGWRDMLRRVAGLVWGDGVWANVAGAYSFIVHNYRPGDRIFVFGFSRGAFTARATAALVDLFGVLREEHDNLIPTLLQVYRSKPKSRADARSESSAQDRLRAAAEFDASGKFVEPPAGPTRRDVGESLRGAFSHAERTPVHFVGVWDTVESVGLSQLALGSRITSDPTVKPAYRHVRHALALDELRWPYEPRLYIDPQLNDAERTFKQVWFAGAHSDVGGGYENCGLANAPLHWMLREASVHGLLVDFRVADRHAINPLDTLHNETASLPLWVWVGAFRRSHKATPRRSLRQRIETLFSKGRAGSSAPPTRGPGKSAPRTSQDPICVHESVIERMNAPAARYAPRLAPAYTVERTTLDYVDAGVAVANRAPPRAQPLVAGTPVKEAWTLWHTAWLLLAGVATGWAFAQHRADESALAALQWLDGRAGVLGQTLLAWHADSGVRVTTLLWSDTLAIACYGLLLPIVAFGFLRIAGRDGAARPILGKAFCYSTSFLPLADFTENVFTYFALRHAPAGPLWSYATFAASCAKYALLAAFLFTAAGCLAAWFARRFGAPRTVARPAT